VKLSDLPAHKLVFVQYIFSLAVAEACRDDTVLGPKSGDKIRIKWPNDIYATFGTSKDDIRKIGGVLVNTSFSGQTVDLVIGKSKCISCMYNLIVEVFLIQVVV